jgi:hypothetical protein
MTNNSRAGTRAPKIVPLSSIIDTDDSYIQPQSDDYTSVQAASFIDPEILEEILTNTIDGESKVLESIENLGKMIDQTKSITNSRLRSAKRVKNYHMHVDLSNNNDFSYTYKMKEGISEIHGGIKVLNDMNYPTEIINNTRNKINQKNSKTSNRSTSE